MTKVNMNGKMKNITYENEKKSLFQQLLLQAKIVVEMSSTLWKKLPATQVVALFSTDV